MYDTEWSYYTKSVAFLQSINRRYFTEHFVSFCLKSRNAAEHAKELLAFAVKKVYNSIMYGLTARCFRSRAG